MGIDCHAVTLGADRAEIAGRARQLGAQPDLEELQRLDALRVERVAVQYHVEAGDVARRAAIGIRKRRQVELAGRRPDLIRHAEYHLVQEVLDEHRRLFPGRHLRRHLVERLAQWLRQAADLGHVVQPGKPLAEVAQDVLALLAGPVRRCFEQQRDGACFTGSEVALDGVQTAHAAGGRGQFASRPVVGADLEAEERQR